MEYRQDGVYVCRSFESTTTPLVIICTLDKTGALAREMEERLAPAVEQKKLQISRALGIT